MRSIKVEGFEYEVPESEVIGLIVENKEEIVLCIQEGKLKELAE